MAKYDVTHSCGHTATHQLFGKHTVREWRIGRLESEPCGACREAILEAQRTAQSEQAATIAVREGLPALEGSEKQVAWAETLRVTRLDGLIGRLNPILARHKIECVATGGVSLLAEIVDRLSDGQAGDSDALTETTATAHAWLAAIRGERSAKWWIDQRDWTLAELAQRQEEARKASETRRAKTLADEADAIHFAEVRAEIRAVLPEWEQNWELKIGTWSGAKRVYFGYGYNRNVAVLHVTGDTRHNPGAIEKADGRLTDAEMAAIKPILDRLAAKWANLTLRGVK